MHLGILPAGTQNEFPRPWSSRSFWFFPFRIPGNLTCQHQTFSQLWIRITKASPNMHLVTFWLEFKINSSGLILIQASQGVLHIPNLLLLDRAKTLTLDFYATHIFMLPIFSEWVIQFAWNEKESTGCWPHYIFLTLDPIHELDYQLKKLTNEINWPPVDFGHNDLSPVLAGNYMSFQSNFGRWLQALGLVCYQNYHKMQPIPLDKINDIKIKASPCISFYSFEMPFFTICASESIMISGKITLQCDCTH